MFDCGLVLEGGGMRGIYTAGVLDYFLDKDIMFANVFGVSAGACHASSYISKQRGRAFRISTDYLKDKNYCSKYSLITTGDMFNVKMCYDTIPNELDPFDYEAFDEYEGKMYVAATDCETGEAEYLRISDMRRDIRGIRASSSLPLISRMVKIGNKQYLDGGIADSIPIVASEKHGNARNVVVLTREDGYRKPSNKAIPLMKIKYRKFPELVNAMANRHNVYNSTLDYINSNRDNGNVFVIQPKQPPDIGRTEKNLTKLKALYEQGYQDADDCFEELLEFIKK